jgi:hypothetical protein
MYVCMCVCVCVYVFVFPCAFVFVSLLLDVPENSLSLFHSSNAISSLSLNLVLHPSLILLCLSYSSTSYFSLSLSQTLIILTLSRTLFPHSASKYASFGFAECLRHELQALAYTNNNSHTQSQSGTGVHTQVNSTVVCPYLVETGMFDGSKLPWYVRLCGISPLRPGYVARRIVQAIEYQEEMVILPDFFRLVGSFVCIMCVCLWFCVYYVCLFVVLCVCVCVYICVCVCMCVCVYPLWLSFSTSVVIYLNSRTFSEYVSPSLPSSRTLYQSIRLFVFLSLVFSLSLWLLSRCVYPVLPPDPSLLCCFCLVILSPRLLACCTQSARCGW